jgi:alkylation response protein AidB-like acyl-CoA dehydrogenase
MDFRLDAEQLALQATTRSFCSDQVPLGTIGERDLAPASDTFWRGLAELGVFSLFAGDGDNEAAIEAAAVFEVLGQYLAPGPILWSTLSAGFVADAATGDVRVTGVESSVAESTAVVPHPAESQLVALLFPDRIALLTANQLPTCTCGPSLDPLTPCAVYEALPTGEVVGEWIAALRLRLRGTALASAMLVGVAQGALDVARSYALEREQFGKPIGSFQAIKHLLADMFVRVELARSATYAAAATIVDARVGEPVRATSAAKLLAGEAAIANSRSAIQILGGMGFTWEMLPHYYLKRAWVLENTFGTGTSHSLALADAVHAEAVA